MPEEAGRPRLGESPHIQAYRKALWQSLEAPDESAQSTGFRILRTGAALPTEEPIFALALAHGAYAFPDTHSFHWPDMLALTQHRAHALSITATTRVTYYLMRMHPTLERVSLAIECYRQALHDVACFSSIQTFINAQLSIADLLGQYRHRMGVFLASAVMHLATQAGLDRSRQVASQLVIMNHYRLHGQSRPLPSFQPRFAGLDALMHSYRDLSQAMIDTDTHSLRQVKRQFAPIMEIQQSLLPSHRRDSAIWYSERCSRLGYHDQATRILIACMEQQRADDRASQWLLARQASIVARRAGWSQILPAAMQALTPSDLERVANLPVRLPLCSTLAQVQALAQTPPTPLDRQRLYNSLASLSRRQSA